MPPVLAEAQDPEVLQCSGNEAKNAENSIGFSIATEVQA
ncbi:hypothetical protein PJE062_399 [Pseudovibrio sp. JE062]|nr:hypothetical protein PJE062_399 [Pseudovibrio sp. JE062]